MRFSRFMVGMGIGSEGAIRGSWTSSSWWVNLRLWPAPAMGGGEGWRADWMHLSLSLRPGLAADIEVRACRSPARMVAASYIAASGETSSTTGRDGEDMILWVLSKFNCRNDVCVKVYDREIRKL
jgi:hypothetical protein